MEYISYNLQNSFPLKSIGLIQEVRGFDDFFLFFRLFNHGVGIHLLETDKLAGKKGKINPKDNHISFQCSDMELVIKKLEEMKIEFVTAIVEEGGITVDQLFFHDPDGYMIEICNCQNLPVLPLSSCPLKLPSPSPNHTASSSSSSSFFSKFPVPYFSL